MSLNVRGAGEKGAHAEYEAFDRLVGGEVALNNEIAFPFHLLPTGPLPARGFFWFNPHVASLA